MNDIQVAVAPRSRKGGGRSARHSQRQGGAGQNAHLIAPYITRGVPPYDLLTVESLLKIEAGADLILAEIGIEFRDDAEAVRLFRAAGGDVT